MVPERIDIGWIDPEYVAGEFAHHLAIMVRDMEYHGCAGKIFRHSAPQPIAARNALMQEFLDTSDSPWLWLIDADILVDKGHVMKLWLAAQDYEADIVTGLSMIWKERRLVVPSLFYEQDDHLILRHNFIPEAGTEVAAAALSTVLIRRKVIETMQAPRTSDCRWFDFLPEIEIGITGNEMAGIDVQFFVRARALGFKMIVEPNAVGTSLENLVIGYNEWRKQWQPNES